MGDGFEDVSFPRCHHAASRDTPLLVTCQEHWVPSVIVAGDVALLGTSTAGLWLWAGASPALSAWDLVPLPQVRCESGCGSLSACLLCY